jgi:hypothetical protein
MEYLFKTTLLCIDIGSIDLLKLQMAQFWIAGVLRTAYCQITCPARPHDPTSRRVTKDVGAASGL